MTTPERKHSAPSRCAGKSLVMRIVNISEMCGSKREKHILDKKAWGKLCDLSRDCLICWYKVI
jgi:hypothetical protein